jgi:hypothetical protein
VLARSSAATSGRLSATMAKTGTAGALGSSLLSSIGLASTVGANYVDTQAVSAALTTAGMRSTTREERESQAKTQDPLFHPAPNTPWVCPHTGVVQNPTALQLLDGAAAVAVVEPVRVATLHALRRVYCSASGISMSGGTSSGPVLPGHDDGPLGAGDEPHLGLTHNDVLSRLHRMSQEEPNLPRANFFQSGGGIALSSSETFVRGVPLIA